MLRNREENDRGICRIDRHDSSRTAARAREAPLAHRGALGILFGTTRIFAQASRLVLSTLDNHSRDAGQCLALSVRVDPPLAPSGSEAPFRTGPRRIFAGACTINCKLRT